MSATAQSYEKLGVFYLGRPYDLEAKKPGEGLLLYDSRDLVTHAVCVGMTGSGKTGLCIGLLEEAAIDGIPAIVIDPKGDLANLLLTFPELRPEDFRPWVNEDDARRKGLSVDEHAHQQADLWREGLASWSQDGKRIQRLRASAEFAIYTPGSDAGLPVSILASFAAPPEALRTESDLYRERIATTVTGLLGLLRIDADPIRSREHILLSTTLDHLWQQGTDTDVGGLIRAIQDPPFERVGVIDLDSFYPPKERFELAMQLNNLLAAPGFQAWMSGEALDVGQLLYTPSGKPRVAIFSIAHLSDAERMFFVSLLLNQTLSWMRTRPGTTSLRALLYMDEIFGFMPPVAEPPSKKPLLTMLKQGRAFGLGVVLATQNPVDLDYKGLSNTGTWFIGRLQTERDKARVLDGLEGADAGPSGFDKKAVDQILSALGERVFLLHNVHEEGPVVFQTRWAMSYLRGPLTRAQIRTLMAGAERAPATAPPDTGAPGAPSPRTVAVRRPSTAPERPIVEPDIREYFVPSRGQAADGLVYAPHLLGLGRVQYVDQSSKRTLQTEDVALLLPLAEDLVNVDWEEAREVEIALGDLERDPEAGAGWAPLPSAARKAKSYTAWKKKFADTLYRHRALTLYRSPTFKVLSEPGETERDFRIRLGDLAREERDRHIKTLRDRYASKVRSLEERIRKAKQRVEVERGQATHEKLQTAISIGATLLAAFTGHSRRRSSTLGRATTAMRGAGRSARQSQDIARAEETVEALTEELERLNAELEAEIDNLEERFDPEAEELENKSVRPRKKDIEVRLVTLAWTLCTTDGALTL